MRPEDCLVGDWICAKMVADWDWTEGVMGHRLECNDGSTRIFELLPYIEGMRQVVWKRVE